MTCSKYERHIQRDVWGTFTAHFSDDPSPATVTIEIRKDKNSDMIDLTKTTTKIWVGVYEWSIGPNELAIGPYYRQVRLTNADGTTDVTTSGVFHIDKMI